MDWVRQWLLGIIACAALVSIIQPLCPDGAARQALRFAGGLLILCAALRPLAARQPPALAWNLADYQAAVAQSEESLSRGAKDAFSSGIAREAETYIEDKADSLGVTVRAAVTTDSRGVPEGVTLDGAYCETLSEWIASELGIAKEKQLWKKP